MAKKFYWLKLKEDFFAQREIKKLRKIAGGDTFVIIYLKMQLLSIRNDGKIEFEGTEENILDQLELELDEDKENIALTIAYLIKNKLLEVIDNDYLLPRACESIGNESDSAERVRRHRENKALQCNKKMLQSNECNVTSNTEIEKEKKKEKKNREKIKNDESTAEIFKFYNNNFGLITQYEAEEISLFLDDDVEHLLIIEAMKIAINNKAKNWGYVRKILHNKLEQGIKTLEQFKAKEKEREYKKEMKAGEFNKVEQCNNFEQRQFTEEYLEQFYS